MFVEQEPMSFTVKPGLTAQNTIHPSEVAKVIIQAVMADNPDFRYEWEKMLS